MVLGGANDLGHALFVADIAGVDPQTGRAGLCRFNRAFVVEMDVGDDRHGAFAHDLLQRGGRCLIGGRDADDIGPRLCCALDLRHGCRHIRAVGIGHRLDGNRRVAPDGDAADHDLAALAAVDVAPGADGIVRHGILAGCAIRPAIARNAGRSNAPHRRIRSQLRDQRVGVSSCLALASMTSSATGSAARSATS